MYPFVMGASLSEVSAPFPAQLLTGGVFFFCSFTILQFIQLSIYSRYSPFSGESWHLFSRFVPAFLSFYFTSMQYNCLCLFSFPKFLDSYSEATASFKSSVFLQQFWIFRFYIKVFDPFLSQTQTKTQDCSYKCKEQGTCKNELTSFHKLSREQHEYILYQTSTPTDTHGHTKHMLLMQSGHNHAALSPLKMKTT